MAKDAENQIQDKMREVCKRFCFHACWLGLLRAS
jgi:hypothetical protein